MTFYETVNLALSQFFFNYVRVCILGFSNRYSGNQMTYDENECDMHYTDIFDSFHLLASFLLINVQHETHQVHSSLWC